MRAKTRAWIDYAKPDLAAALRLVDDERFGNIVAYHYQQCVEKCLKALLEENSSSIPRSHSILHLMKTVTELYPHLSLGIDDMELALFDDIYTDMRYPGSRGLLPAGIPSVEQARQFINNAEKTLSVVIKILS